MPAARRRNSFGGTDASKLPPPRPVVDPQHAAQMAAAKEFQKFLQGPKGRGQSFVPRGNFGKHGLVPPRVPSSQNKIPPPPPKAPANALPATKPASSRPRLVPLKRRLAAASQSTSDRPPVSTKFDRSWAQTAGAALAKRTTSNNPSSSAHNQRQSSATSSTGNIRQTPHLHQRVASSSSHGTGLDTQNTSGPEHVPDEDFNDIYDVSPRSRYRPPPSDLRTIHQPSVCRMSSGSSRGTALNVTTATIPEVPPAVPEKPEDEHGEEWGSDETRGVQPDFTYCRRAHSAPPAEADLLNLYGPSVAATPPRGAALELRELEDELQWITQLSIPQPDFGYVRLNDDEHTPATNNATQHDDISGGHSSDSSMLMDFSSPGRNMASQTHLAHATDLPRSNANFGGFTTMPPSLMDDPFEMGPSSRDGASDNTSAVNMTAEGSALVSHQAEQPTGTSHGEVPINERSRRIAYARDEMVALRENTNPELVANIVESLRMTRLEAGANIGESLRTARRVAQSPLSNNEADRSSRKLSTRMDNELPSTIYTPAHPFTPKIVKREQSIGYGAVTHGFSPFNRTPVPISVKLEKSYGHAKTFDSSMFSPTRPFIPKVVKREDSYGYRGPKTNQSKSETPSDPKAKQQPADAKKASGGLGQSRWASPPRPDTTSTLKAAPEPAGVKKASGGLGQSRWADPPKKASASAAATTTSGPVSASTTARNFSGNGVFTELIKAKKLGGLADSKYADDAPDNKSSRKPSAKPVAPVRAAPPPITPTGGGRGNPIRPHPQGPESSRGRGRSSGKPAASNATDENVSPLQLRGGRGRGGFGGDGANSVSPSPASRPRREPSSPTKSPTRSEKGLGDDDQDSIVEADGSALADATNRGRASTVTAPVHGSPKRKLVALAGVAEFDPVSWQQTLLADAQTNLTSVQQQPQTQRSVVPYSAVQQPVAPDALLRLSPSQPAPVPELSSLLLSTDPQSPTRVLTGYVWLPDLNAPGRVRRMRCLVRGNPWVDPSTTTVMAKVIYHETDGSWMDALGNLDGPPADVHGNRWFADLFATVDDLSRGQDAIIPLDSFIAPGNVQPATILGHQCKLDNVRANGSRGLPAALPTAYPPAALLGMPNFGVPGNVIASSQGVHIGNFVPFRLPDRSHAQRLPNPSSPFAPSTTASPSPERPRRVSQAIPIRRPEDVPTRTRASRASVSSSVMTRSQSTTPRSPHSPAFVPARVGRSSAAIPIRRPEEAATTTPSPAADTIVGRMNGAVNGIVSARHNSIDHDSPAPCASATPIRQPRGPGAENNFSALAHLPRDTSPLTPSWHSMFPQPPQRRLDRVTLGALSE